MRKQHFVPLAAAIIWILGLTFVFQADLAGEIASEVPLILSGTDQAMAIAIETGSWRSEIPPPALGSWNEPLLRSRLRARVPELFPADRESYVHASSSGASASHEVKSGTLYLQFQYDSSRLTASEATNSLTRLADAYIDELAQYQIKARTSGSPVKSDADIRPLYIALMFVKSLAAAIASFFLVSLLLLIDRSRLGLAQSLKISLGLFLVGCLGLLLVQIEFVTKPQFAGTLPDSIMLLQEISVTHHKTKKTNAIHLPTSQEPALDWKAIPASHFWRREMIRRDYPDISLDEANARVQSYPFDTAVLRGEKLNLSAGWYFSVRVAKSLADRIDPTATTNLEAARSQRDDWLSMLFTHMKNGYEGKLANLGIQLTSPGEVIFIYDYPLAPPATRLRAGLALLLTGMGLLWWLRRWLNKKSGSNA